MNHPRFRQFMMILASVVSVIYLVYRAAFTLNLVTPYATFASILLYSAEIYGVCVLLLYFLQVWDPQEPELEPPLSGRSVDIFVPTYNEDPAMLRATLEACIRMDYPHEVYLLDDGKRPEVEALAKELGVHYIIRPDNRHAKAGNLNHAFEKTNGEFVVVFDADHVPEPNFITRLIGYFRDEQLAFVQTPHAFYNFDSFQARLNHKARKYWDEGAMFYKVIQPGRNRWNCPIFAGSAVMFRRRALQEVGYIATETITEDMHTGMRMHARGWKSLAVTDRLVCGQAAPDITTFHTQRLRWGEGNLSIMAFDNPLTMKGLTMAQRMCYFGSMVHWASGLFKLFLYATPILMLFTGVPPVDKFTWTLFALMLTYVITSYASYKIAGNGHSSIVNSELFSMVNFWTSIRATFRAMFWRKFSRFIVTSKRGRQSKSIWPYIRPQVILAIISLMALTWGWSRVIFRISDDPFKPIVPTVWVLLHMFLIYLVTRRAFWPEDRRFNTRHMVHLPVTYELLPIDPDGPRFGVTSDLNDTGLGFVAYEVLPPNAVIKVVIRGAGQVVECEAQVKTAKPLSSNGTMHGYRYGCAFRNLSPQDVDILNRICLHYAVPRLYAQYDSGNRDNIWHRIGSWRERGMSQRRNAFRYPYNLPAVLYRYGARDDGSAYEPIYSATEDLSRTAYAVLVDEPIQLGTQIGYFMQTPLGEIRGYARVLRYEVKEFAATKYYRVILEFGDFEGQGRTTLMSLVNPREAGEFGSILTPDKRPLPVNMTGPVLIGIVLALPLLAMQTGLFRYVVHKEDFFLREVVEAPVGSVTQEQKDKLDSIYEDSWNATYPSTDRLVLLMSALSSVGREREIDEITKRLAPRDRNNTDLQLALAQSLDDTEEYARAEAEYQRLLDLASKGQLTVERQRDLRLAAARSYVHAAQATGEQARYDKAFEQFRDLIKEYPTDNTLRNEFAGVLITANRLQEARQLYSGIEPDIEGRKRLIAVYALEQNYEQAAAEARSLLRLRPNDPEGEMLLAGVLQAQKSFGQSRAIYERLLTREPLNRTLQRKLAEVALGSKQFDAAIDRYSRLLSSGESDKRIVQGFIDAASSAGEAKLTPAVRQQVIGVYDKTLTASTEDPTFLGRLAWVLQRLGENEKSAAMMERATALDPEDPDLRKQFLGVLIASGRFENALNLLGSDENSIEVRRLNLAIHLRSKQYEAAERECRRILEVTPDDFQTKLLLADMLTWDWKRDFPQAIRLYNELAAAQPANREIPIRLAQVALWSSDYPLAVKRFEAILDRSLDELKPTVVAQLWLDFIDSCAGVDTLTENQAKLVLRALDRPPFLDSKDPAQLTRMAWVLLNADDLKRANAVLDRALAQQLNDPRVRNDLAGVLSRAKRYKEAVALLANEKPRDNAERLKLAELYAGAEDFSRAAELIHDVVISDPDNKKALRLEADILSWKKDYRGSLDALNRLLEKDPTNPEIPRRIAEVTLWSGSMDPSAYDRALVRFQALLDQTIDQPKLWTMWADAAASARVLTPANERMARRIYEKLMLSDNKDISFHCRLATVLNRIKDFSKAEAIVDRALALKPTTPEEKREMAGALAVLKRFQEALAMYDGVPITPKDRLAYIGIAAAAEDFESAAIEAKKLVDENPEDKNARRLYAEVLSWKHDYDASLTEFKQLLAATPNDAELMVAIAKVTLWSARYPEALLQFQALLTGQLDQPELWGGFIDAAAQIRQLNPEQANLALTIYDKLIDAPGVEPARLSRLGWVLNKLGETAKVDKLLDRAVSMNPQEPAIRKEIAGVLAARGRFAEARSMYDGTDLNINDRINLANLLTADSNFNDAEVQLRNALKEQPTSKDIKTQLADVLTWNKKYPQAISFYQQLAAAYPQDDKVALKLALALLWYGSYDEAFERFYYLLQKDPQNLALWKGYIEAASLVDEERLTVAHRRQIQAIDREGPARIPEAKFLAQLGWVNGRIGQRQRANLLFKQALSMEPNSRQIRLQLAESYYSLGQYEQAEQLFKGLLSSNTPSK